MFTQVSISKRNEPVLWKPCDIETIRTKLAEILQYRRKTNRVAPKTFNIEAKQIPEIVIIPKN